MKTVTAHDVMGLPLVVFGLGGFFNFFPPPATPLPEEAIAFAGALAKLLAATDRGHTVDRGTAANFESFCAAGLGSVCTVHHQQYPNRHDTGWIGGGLYPTRERGH